jgi:hypothetical protein
MTRDAYGARLGGLRHRPEERTMLTPTHTHETHEDLGDLLEDFGFSLMLFAAVAIAATILVLLLVF